MRTIRPVPLIPDAFEPFGTVTSVPGATGAGGVSTQGVAGAFAATGDAPNSVLSLVRVEAVPKPLSITQLEIRPHSSQSFLALDKAHSLVVVCQPDAQGRPDPETLLAFVARPDQVVTYGRGVLHHRLTPLHRPASFAMAMRQTVLKEDTVLLDLTHPVMVILDD